VKKVNFTKIILLLIVLLISCTAAADDGNFKPYDPNKLHQTVYIDEKFTISQKSDIIKSLHSWESSTNNLVKFTIFSNIKPLYYGTLDDFDNTLFITPVDDDNIEITNNDKIYNNGLFTVALHISKSYTVGAIIEIVMSRTTENDFKAVLMHEEGHALGLRHILNEHSIMHPNASIGSKKIAQIDLRALCDLYFCDNNKMTPINY
jgi:predicted Zn-dependent protease